MSDDMKIQGGGVTQQSMPAAPAEAKVGKLQGHSMTASRTVSPLAATTQQSFIEGVKSFVIDKSSSVNVSFQKKPIDSGAKVVKSARAVSDACEDKLNVRAAEVSHIEPSSKTSLAEVIANGQAAITILENRKTLLENHIQSVRSHLEATKDSKDPRIQDHRSELEHSLIGHALHLQHLSEEIPALKEGVQMLKDVVGQAAKSTVATNPNEPERTPAGNKIFRLIRL